MRRFAVIRVPTFGPPALVGEPNVFGTEAEALFRIAEIEAAQRIVHHTHLECVPVDGPLADTLSKLGILF